MDGNKISSPRDFFFTPLNSFRRVVAALDEIIECETTLIDPTSFSCAAADSCSQTMVINVVQIVWVGVGGVGGGFKFLYEPKKKRKPIVVKSMITLLPLFIIWGKI